MASRRNRDRTYRRTLLLRFSLIGLAVTVLMAAVLAYFLQRQLVEDALQSASEIAVTQVAATLRPNLTAADVAQPFFPELHARLDMLAARELETGGIVRIRIWNREGTVIYSNVDAGVGYRDGGSAGLAAALAGKT